MWGRALALPDAYVSRRRASDPRARAGLCSWSMVNTQTGTKPARRRKRDVLASLGQPKVAVMLALGFSSGLPFLLSGNTLGYWLRDEGTTLKAIGFLSWVGLAYSFKFLWAPVVDRLDAPLFGRFGRRRSWMLLTQVLVAV